MDQASQHLCIPRKIVWNKIFTILHDIFIKFTCEKACPLKKWFFLKVGLSISWTKKYFRGPGVVTLPAIDSADSVCVYAYTPVISLTSPYFIRHHQVDRFQYLFEIVAFLPSLRNIPLRDSIAHSRIFRAIKVTILRS